MTARSQRPVSLEVASRRTLRLSIGAAALCSLCVTLLITDYGVMVAQSRADTIRVDALREQVKSDASIAAALHGERERQTDASLARNARAKWAAWTLLAAGATLIGSAKRYLSLRPQPVPSLDEMVAVRFPSAPPQKRKRPEAPRADDSAANEVDLAFIDQLIARTGGGREAAIPILQAIQTHFRYLPDEALRRVCERTAITPAQIEGTSSFYAQFRRSPVGRHVVRVCHGTACHVAGADQITNELRRHLEIAADQDTDSQRRFTIDAVACVGCCSLAPVMMIEDDTAGRLTPSTARRALEALESDA